MWISSPLMASNKFTPAFYLCVCSLMALGVFNERVWAQVVADQVRGRGPQVLSGVLKVLKEDRPYHNTISRSHQPPRGTAADHLTASHLPCCPRYWQPQYMAEKKIKCAVCDWTQSLCGILKQLCAVLLNPFLLFQWWKDWKCTAVILLHSPQMLYRWFQIRKEGVRIFTVY